MHGFLEATLADANSTNQLENRNLLQLCNIFRKQADFGVFEHILWLKEISGI